MAVNEFKRVLMNFEQSLTKEQQDDFRFSTLEDLQTLIDTIQKKQGSERKMRNLTRLRSFLEAMEQYGQVIEVFLNTSNFISFIWGPTKFLLQVASAYAEAFDALLDAYQQIGENIPLFSQYQNLFERNPHMRRVLGLIYTDILEFHKNALKYFQQRMWRQLFQATWKTFRTKFSSLLENLRRHRRLVESQANLVQFEELFQELQKARIKSEAEFQSLKDGEMSQRLNTVGAWLSAANTNIDQETRTRKRKKYPASGRWLLNDNRMQAWFDPEACATPLLWVNGIPGAGKSVLASLIVEESLKLHPSHPVSVAFFYCKHNDLRRNTFNAVARGILVQLLHQNDALLPYLFEKASSSGETVLETPALTKELLETALRSLEKVYIIIDGLDECERNEKKMIVSWFRSMIDTLPEMDPNNLRCLFLSQDDGEVGKLLSKVPTIQIKAENTKQDIEAYAAAWSKKLQAQFEGSDIIREEIYSTVTERADGTVVAYHDEDRLNNYSRVGMFLFAKLAMKHLKSQLTREDLIDELKPDKFPQGLEEVYARIVDRILKGGKLPVRNAAAKLLGWLVCAKRPLKWHEIQGAVSINLDAQNIDFEERKLRADVKSLCGSLVERRSDDSIDLVHLTAKFFLVDQSYIKLAPVELGLARLCFGYLSFRCFDDEVPETEMRAFVWKGYYSFLDYATIHWVDHLESWIREAGDTETVAIVTDLLQTFLHKYWSKTVCKTAIPREIRDKFFRFETCEIFDLLVRAVSVWKMRRTFQGSYGTDSESLDLVLGVTRARRILEKVVSASSENDALERKLTTFYGTNLYKCPRVSCNFFVNGFLTEPQRDRHLAKHERGFNCTYFGCLFGTLGFKTFRDLEKHTADSHGEIQNAISKFPVTGDPKSINIKQAIRNGCEQEVEKWVEQFNGKRSFNSLKWEVLESAMAKGEASIIQILLTSVDKISAKNVSQLIKMAMMSKQDEIAFLFLAHPLADPWLRAMGDTPCPVFAAIEYEREAIFKHLIEDRGLDLNHHDKQRQTVLSEAVRHGRLTMVQLLLETGKCEIDSPGRDGDTPIHIAARKGHEIIFRMLLETGKCNVNSTNKILDTPIHSAAREGHEAIVRLLIGTGNCNVDRKNKSEETPTAHAARNGNENILRILEQHKPPPDDFQKWLRVAQLLNAARDGEEGLVRQLLAREDIPVDMASFKDGRTPLMYAAERGHDSVVEQLLARRDINPNKEAATGRSYSRKIVTPLLLAVLNGHESIVRHLLARGGIDLKSKTRYKRKAVSYMSYLTALEIAQETGQESVAQLLKEHVAKSAQPNKAQKEAPKVERLPTMDESLGTPRDVLEDFDFDSYLADENLYAKTPGDAPKVEPLLAMDVSSGSPRDAPEDFDFDSFLANENFYTKMPGDAPKVEPLLAMNVSSGSPRDVLEEFDFDSILAVDSPRSKTPGGYLGSQSSHANISASPIGLDFPTPGRSDQILENTGSMPTMASERDSKRALADSVKKEMCNHKIVDAGVCFDCRKIFPVNGMLFKPAAIEPENSIITLPPLN